MKTSLKIIAILFLAVAMLYFRLSAEPGTHRHYATSTHHARSGRTYTRDPAVRRAFMRQHPCPSTGWTWGSCPGGWVVDHVVPLCKGGADATWNMQWQSAADAKAKDKVECK